jgi:hypothetical protein
MLYLPIKRSWIVSRWAQRVYFCCALANFYLVAVLAGSRVAVDASGLASLAEFPGTAWMVKILLFPGVLGTALLVVAMWYFWFTFDQSHWIKKTLWFAVLFPGFLVGPALYHFFSYRRNAALEGRA